MGARFLPKEKAFKKIASRLARAMQAKPNAGGREKTIGGPTDLYG
jgi:hypothetical protein